MYHHFNWLKIKEAITLELKLHQEVINQKELWSLKPNFNCKSTLIIEKIHFQRHVVK